MKKKSKLTIITLVFVIAIVIIPIIFLWGKNNPNKNINEKSAKSDLKEETAKSNEQGNNTDEQDNLKDKINNIKYDKYYIDEDIKDYANPSNRELYKKLYDAVDQVKTNVSAADYEISNEESEHQKSAIYDRMLYEFFYLKNVQYNADKKQFEFSYWTDKNTIEKMKAEFNKKADSLVNSILKSSNSDLEKEFLLLDYLSENSTFEDPVDVLNSGVYGILINKKGVCKDYTAAGKYILSRVGVESHDVTIKTSSIFHAINQVKIDGEYYYLDTSTASTRALDRFNFTEKELKEFYGAKDGEFYLGNSNYKKIKVFKSDNNRFAFLRSAVDYKLDNGNVYYYNFSDDNKIYKAELKNGETAIAISQDSINGMVMYGDYIYYINHSDSDHIYKIKKDGTGREAIDKSMAATMIKIINNQLYYTDGEKEIYKKMPV